MLQRRESRIAPTLLALAHSSMIIVQFPSLAALLGFCKQIEMLFPASFPSKRQSALLNPFHGACTYHTRQREIVKETGPHARDTHPSRTTAQPTCHTHESAPGPHGAPECRLRKRPRNPPWCSPRARRVNVQKASPCPARMRISSSWRLRGSLCFMGFLALVNA